MNNQPKYRRPLNPNQLITLQFIFKFRFVTAPLLSSAYGNKSRSTTQRTLQTLEEQQYLGKLYNSSYRLQGKQAVYYLLPKAVRELKTRYNYNDSALNPMLRNSSVGDDFIEHNLDVLREYISLQKQYPKVFHIFTSYELDRFDYFPKPAPDLYLNRIKPVEDYPKEYLLDIYTYKPPFVIKKRIDGYIKHCELQDWQTEAKTDYPIVLLSCPNARVEAAIQAYAVRKLVQSEVEGELTILTSTTRALLGGEAVIWSGVNEPGELVSLLLKSTIHERNS